MLPDCNRELSKFRTISYACHRSAIFISLLYRKSCFSLKFMPRKSSIKVNGNGRKREKKHRSKNDNIVHRTASSLSAFIFVSVANKLSSFLLDFPHFMQRNIMERLCQTLEFVLILHSHYTSRNQIEVKIRKRKKTQVNQTELQSKILYNE